MNICIYLCIHMHRKWWTLSITIKSFFSPFYYSFLVYLLLCPTSSSFPPPPSPQSQATTDSICFLSLQVTLHFLEFYINGVHAVCTHLLSSFYQSNNWGSPMLRHVSVVIPFYCWTVFQCMPVPVCYSFTYWQAFEFLVFGGYI